ncbi:MAG: tripartite tricarboxylate transporter permease [SAR324 cluster bacterium]|nr:tripartite tricarboxylate transporter permease [SAR324 cluster bacterium]
MLDGMLLGLETAFTFQNLFFAGLGCFIGTIIGMLPGLGPMSVVAIMIPVSLQIGDPSTTLILLAGVYYGAIFGGSTSSILINAPGEAAVVATAFDGYPMARKGQAGKALTIAAISSFSGGTIGVVLLMLFAPALAGFAILFWSAEYFALMLLGLSAVSAFAGKGKVLKAVMMTLLGLMLATVGESSLFHAPRFTMGVMDLQSGINFVTLAMGLFAVPEAFFLAIDKIRSKKTGKSGAGSSKKSQEISNLRINRKEAKAIVPVIARQSIQGFLIGVMPGTGATIASFLGYAVERNLASPEEREEFGKGSIKGLAAPETANNAASTGSFVPLLTLGIPGSGTTAVLLGAFIALNLQPGPQLLQERPEVFWSIIMSMYFGNIILLVLNLPLVPYIAKLLSIPRTFLIPFVLFFAMAGAYIGQNNATELLLLLGFGVVAIILRFAEYPLPPLLIGFVLGQMFEDNLGRAMRNANGIEFVWERPMTLTLILSAVVFILFPLLRDWLVNKRKKI